MSDLDTFVESKATISDASSPTVQSLSTGLIACYHTLSASRVLLFSTSGVLAALLAMGFTTNSPAYKAASLYAAAPNAPAQVCIGRRALPPLQTLQLRCTDGADGDANSFTLLSPAGVSAALSYTNVINPGVAIVGSALTGTVTLVPGSPDVTFSAAQTLPLGAQLVFSTQPGVTYTVADATSSSASAILTANYTGAASSVATTALGGTTSVTNGSATVTFSIAQSLAKGELLTFAEQPGVYYALNAAVVSSTSGTLTTAFQGATNAATPTTVLGVLAGTFDVIAGSAVVAATSSQVAAVSPGDSVAFAAQPNTTYTVLSVTASALTLTTPYSGTTVSNSNGSDVCQVSTAAANLAYQIGLLADLGTVSVVNTPSPTFPNIVQLARIDGQLTDVQGWRAGGANGVNGFGNIELTDTTADPGIATDLAAMVAANGAAFYGVILDSNSQAEVQAAASFIEAQGGAKFLFCNTSDYGNGQVADTTDLFSELQGLSLVQTLCQENNQKLLCYAGAAACGQGLAQNPGSYNFAYMTQPLVPVDNDTTLTQTESSAINTQSAAIPGTGGKNGNFYRSAGGKNFLWPGTTPSGQYADLTIGLDWLRPQIQAAIVVALSSLPKTPFTDFGLQKVGNAIRSVLNLAAGTLYNFLLPNGADPLRPLVVNVPLASSLTPSQRASRDISGITWSAGIQGAIDTATVNGVLLP